jgi:hypothetical protein
MGGKYDTFVFSCDKNDLCLVQALHVASFFSSRAMRFGGAIPLRAGAMISEMSGYVCLFSSISERERDHSDVFSSMSGRVCGEVVGEDWRVLAASSTAYNSGNDG